MSVISYKDLLDAFETIAMCPPYGMEVTRDREAGKNHCCLQAGDNPEPLPDDMDDPRSGLGDSHLRATAVHASPGIAHD